jgi:hypothetical protein
MPASKPGEPAKAPSAHRVHRAVEQKNSTRVTVPVIGEITLPEPSSLAYDAVIVGLAALEFIEPPVAAVLLVGHMFARQRGRSKTKQAIEQALDDAT